MPQESQVDLVLNILTMNQYEGTTPDEDEFYFVTDGVIDPSDLPVATTSSFGAVKPDGTTVTISDGVISATGGGTSVEVYYES